MGKHYPNLDHDAVVIGAGFGGLYAVHKLKNELNLDVQAFEKGSDVGGTWYWNRYPGAMSDSESHVYRYSFDKQLLQEDTWERTYLSQPEILQYLNRVTDRFNLRENYQFDTEVTDLKYNEQGRYWEVTTNKGDKVTCKFLVTALGMLSRIYTPDFPGKDRFRGEMYHTGAWPEDVSLKGKKVGVIGTGSTGIQLIAAIAPEVEHLYVFQRSAQYTVPLGLRKQTPEEIAEIKKNYDQIWDVVRNSMTGFGFPDPERSALDVSDKERERLFEEAWERGNGFYFMFGVFNDIATNPIANEYAADFIRKKIREIVNDPETARKLTPIDPYAKRPAADNGYYATFNRENVSLVDIKFEEPIVEFTPRGIRTKKREYELDMVIFATGFDAVDGNYVKMNLIGRNGVTIKDKWKDGPTGYMGMMEADFPNMFMILGPLGPFSNLVPAIETEVDWIGNTVKYVLEKGHETVEPSAEAVEKWRALCKEIADATVFAKTQSWIFGANVPGKKESVRHYMGGLQNFRLETERRGFSELVFDKELK